MEADRTGKRARPINRPELLQALGGAGRAWDFIVIGGGAAGLGAAVEAASRGYQTLLLERGDFACGTSSRSTKLVHGGVRYLRQGRLALVRQALYERGLLLRNAPHLAHRLPCVLPLYAWWERPSYGLGLKAYDWLAGRQGLGPSRFMPRQETLQRLPNLQASGLRGGILYYDGQFDDARLAVCLARTLLDLGGVPLNYVAAAGFLKTAGKIAGVLARDVESGQEYSLPAKAVINATGVFSDALRRLDAPDAPALIAPSQGAHLVLDRAFFPGEAALVVPRTDDGRVLFLIPWLGRLLVGTTDTPVIQPARNPRPLPREIDFLLDHAARYLNHKPRQEDVFSAFAGLRPLVGAAGQGQTAGLSRDHAVLVSASGLVSVVGGKWTTYRRMGEDVIDRALGIARLAASPSRSARLRLHGWREERDSGPWSSYGSDADLLAELARSRPELDRPLHPRLPYRALEVLWAVRYEFARTVEDVLARRSRALFLDAEASLAMAPEVAALMAKELGRDELWQSRQLEALAQSLLGGGGEEDWCRLA